jgi:hypothetical protein
MKTKTLKLSATDMPDNGRTRVIYKQFELFGPVLKAQPAHGLMKPMDR